MKGIVRLVVLLLCLRVAAADEGKWLETPAVPIDGGLTRWGPVVQMLDFDGKLYVRQMGDGKRRLPIVAYDPKTDRLIFEQKTDAMRLGVFRRIGDALVVPEADVEGRAGWWMKSKGGEWERVKTEAAGIDDVTFFDSKCFLACRDDTGGTQILWSPWQAGGKPPSDRWHVERLTAQAARQALGESRFLQFENFLFILTRRWHEPPKGTIDRLAPLAWGGWYLLRYWPKGSERKLMWDGPPNPSRALRLLAPESGLAAGGFGVADDTTRGDGLLFVTRGRDGVAIDPKGGLFVARPKQTLPWCGWTPVSRRIEGLKEVRAVTVHGETCYVLCSPEARKEAHVLASADLANWKTVFEGQLSATATALATLRGDVYVGLYDGRVGLIRR